MAILLGIDIGTTKTACVVLDAGRDALLFCASEAHHAEMTPGVQDPAKHFLLVENMLRSIPDDLKNNISAIGVTGQMHGVVLWNQYGNISPLYTWQSTVPDITRITGIESTLCQGFGITTLAHLQAENKLAAYTYSGTIMDYIVWNLTGQPDRVMIDQTNAASWGAYDLHQHCFRSDVLKRLFIPAQLLPEIVPPGTCAGELKWGKNEGLPCGIPVMSAVGDNQASVFFTSHDPENELFLTIGTGSQLSAITETVQSGALCDYRPYPDGRYLAVAAPLCGGASWALLAELFRQTLTAYGAPVPDDATLYRKLDEMALSEINSADLPVIQPHFLGERHDSSLRGAIGNLTLNNVTPGKLAAGFALGIIRNLRDSLPETVRNGRTQLLCSGNAIRRNQSLQKACTILFGMPCQFPESREEAACGAALLAERLLD